MYPVTAPGGVELFTAETARLLAILHEVTVLLFTLDLPTISWQERVGNVRMTRLPGSKSSFPHREIKSDDIHSLLHADTPDIAYIISPYLMPFEFVKELFALHIPWIVHLHDYYLICPRIKLLRRNNRLCRGPGMLRCANCVSKSRHPISFLANLSAYGKRLAYARFILEHAKIILTDSRCVQDIFSLQMGIAQERFVVMPPLGTLRPEVFRKRGDTDVLRIGFFGGASEAKGVHILARALADVDCPWRLSVYNVRKHDFRKVTRHFTEHEDRVELHEAFTPDMLDTIFQDLDVLAVPSIWPETYCRAADEAIARGVIVVASDIGGMAERLVDGVNSFTFRPGDAKELATKLSYIFDNLTTLKNSMTFDPMPPQSYKGSETLLDIFASLNEDIANQQ